MIEFPPPSIYWGLLSRGIVKIINRLKIDAEFVESPHNPFITVAYKIARVRYQLVVRTHGWPSIPPQIIFTRIKGLGEVKNKAVSPSGLGEVNGAMRLKLFKNELPSKSELFLNVDFDIEIDTQDLVTMAFSEDQKTIDENNTEIEVLCTNKCDFPLEQIALAVRKTSSFQTPSVKVFMLDKGSHQVGDEVNPMIIKKGDDYIEWTTRFDRQESVLFKVVAQ